MGLLMLTCREPVLKIELGQLIFVMLSDFRHSCLRVSNKIVELLFLAFVHVVIDTAWSLNRHMDRLTHVREMWLIIDPLVLSGRLELLMAHIVVSERCLSPVVVVIPDVTVLRLIHVVSIHKLEIIFIIVKVVFLLVLTIILLILWFIFDNGLVVLILIKEAVKRSNPGIEVLLLLLIALLLLLLLLPLSGAHLGILSTSWVRTTGCLIDRENWGEHRAIEALTLLLIGWIWHDITTGLMHSWRDSCWSGTIGSHHHRWHHVWHGTVGLHRWLLGGVRFIMHSNQC